MTYEQLKNFYDIFQKDIEELKFPDELLNANNNNLKDNNIIYYKKWECHEKNGTLPIDYHKNEKIFMKENICIHEKKRFIFLLSSVGKELILDNLLTTSRDKKKENEHIFGNNFLVIRKESNNNYLTIVNKNNNYIYAVIVRNPNIYMNHLNCQTKEQKIYYKYVANEMYEKYKNNQQNISQKKKNVKYSFVYSLYKHCHEEVKKKKYKNHLDYFININFIKEKFKLLKIKTINISNLIWNFQFSKELLKNKLTNMNHGNFLCYIICPDILNKEYKLYLYNIIKKKKKKKNPTDTIFYIVKENDKDLNDVPREEKTFHVNYKEQKKNKRYDSDEKKASDHKHINVYNKEDKTLYLQNKNEMISISDNKVNRKNITFYKNISSILNLLNEENELYLQIYNIETYTRIFIYNCEEMNKLHFFHFLKTKYKNFYTHIVNLNTLFGIYLNDTERNILKVFNKCKYILKKNIYKHVFLIIDGIDILAKNVQKEFINDNDYNNKHNHFDKEYINLLNNENETNNVYISPSSSPNHYNNNHSRVLTTLLLCLDSIDTIKKENNNKKKIKTNINENKKIKYNHEQNKNDISNMSFQSDHYSSSDLFEKSSLDTNTIKQKNKTNKISNGVITYNFKNLQQIYKQKCIELKKKKTTNNISVIMLSDVHMNLYNLSLIRAGRFFHFINYLSDV